MQHLVGHCMSHVECSMYLVLLSRKVPRTSTLKRYHRQSEALRGGAEAGPLGADGMPPELLPASQGSDADGDSREEDGGDAGVPAVLGREPAPNELASRPCPTTHRASGALTRPWEGGAARSSESPARSQGMHRGGARASV